jgi:hypothetical protein
VVGIIFWEASEESAKETDTLILKILGMITVAVCLLALLSFFTDLKFNHLFFKIYLYGKGLLSPFCLLIYFLYEKITNDLYVSGTYSTRFVPAGFGLSCSFYTTNTK